MKLNPFARIKKQKENRKKLQMRLRRVFTRPSVVKTKSV